MGTIKLFGDGDDGDDVSKDVIEVNKDFIRKFEYNKKREDLQRYEELKKKGLIDGEDDNDDSESESELSDDDDDDNAGVANKKDIKFFDKLLLVKNRHPCLTENVPLFSDDSEEEELGEKQKKKKKKEYLKDVNAKNLIEEGPEFDDAETSEGKRGKTYNEEQEEFRKEFLDAVKNAEGEEDGELLKEKDGSRLDGEDDADKEFESKLGEYFGQEKELDEEKMFLKEFFKNKMWKDNKRRSEQEKMVEEELSDDEEAIDRQEEYEARYNFRHEENVGDRVMGHSRVVEGTVRKKENPRKEQRKKKEERMKIAEMERKEELKHLKNLKKKEMEEKIQKVMKVAGIDSNDCPMDLNELEDDFDPEEYDKMMKKTFDENYYKAEDADPKFGSDDDDDDEDIQKPDFDKEDEMLGLSKGWDNVDDVDDFSSVRERILKEKGEEEGGEQEEGKRKRKRKLSLVENTKQELLDEYYKLDYEGTIGDIKTRFKYAKVDPNKFGLKTADILLLEDKDLNQYVSVKKLAPYREEEWKVPGSLKMQYKLKARELKRRFKSRRDGRKQEQLKGKKNDISNEEEEEEEASSSGLSRKARRKMKQAPLKLSQSRLSAYGKPTQEGGKKKKKKL
ncbi:Protein KRI1 homolog [Linum grandiflorum]